MSIDAFSVSAFNGPALWLLGMFGLEGGTRRGLEFFRMLRVDKSDDLLGCFFSLSLFLFSFSRKEGLPGISWKWVWNGSGLTSRVKYLFVEIHFFFSSEEVRIIIPSYLLFSDKVI